MKKLVGILSLCLLFTTNAYADPSVVVCPVDTWTKVATNVSGVTVQPHPKDTQKHFLYTWRDTGNPAPSDTTDAVYMHTDGFHLSVNPAIDVYVRAKSAGSSVLVWEGSPVVSTSTIIKDNPTVFIDTNFVTGDSPISLDVNAALGHNGTVGTIHNNGIGIMTIATSNDGISFMDPITLAPGDRYLITTSVNTIRLTWVSNTSYQVVVA